jgi:hypothetical protein
MTSKNQNSEWYEEITEKSYSLAEKFGLDDVQTQELVKFINRMSKDQFMRGNKAGIRWASSQIK